MAAERNRADAGAELLLFVCGGDVRLQGPIRDQPLAGLPALRGAHHGHIPERKLRPLQL